MARALAATIVLTGEDGQPIVLHPGTVPNAETAALITNPLAWADAEVDEVEVEEPAAEVEAEVAESAEAKADEAPADEVQEPPAPQDDVKHDDVEDEAPAKSRKRSK